MKRKILYRGGSFVEVVDFWNHDETGKNWVEREYHELGEYQIRFEPFHQLSESESKIFNQNGFELSIAIDKNNSLGYLEEPIKKTISVSYSGDFICNFIKLPSDLGYYYFLSTTYERGEKFISFNSLLQKIESLKIEKLLYSPSNLYIFELKITNNLDLTSERHLLLDLSINSQSHFLSQECISNYLKICKDGVLRINGVEDWNHIKRLIRSEKIGMYELINESPISFVFREESDYFIKIKYSSNEDRFEIYHDESIIDEKDLLMKKFKELLSSGNIDSHSIICYENFINMKAEEIFPKEKYIEHRIMKLEEEIYNLSIFLEIPGFDTEDVYNTVAALKLELEELRLH